MNKPAAGLALLGLQGFSRVGWTSLPTTSNFSSLRREHPSWTLDASLRVTAGRGRIAVFADRCLLLQETPLVVHRLVEQGPGPSAVPLRVGRPLPEAPISCPARMLWVLDGIRPCLTTSEPRLSVSQWPNSTGARCIGEATQSSISPASGSTSVANKKDGGNNQLAQFGQPKVDVRFFGAEPPRSKQGSRSGLAACSRGTRRRRRRS